MDRVLASNLSSVYQISKYCQAKLLLGAIWLGLEKCSCNCSFLIYFVVKLQ